MNSINIDRLYGCLLILRCISRYFVENCGDSELAAHYGVLPDSKHMSSDDIDITVAIDTISDTGSFQYNMETPAVPLSSTPFAVLLRTLVDILVHVQVTDDFYGVHLESLQLILVLLGRQMFCGDITQTSLFLRFFLNNLPANIDAVAFSRVLLSNFMSRITAPTTFIESNPGVGMISSVASGIFSVPKKAFSFLWSGSLSIGGSDTTSEPMSLSKNGPMSDALVAELSILVLLVLVMHQSKAQDENPYRIALSNFHDSHVDATHAAIGSRTLLSEDLNKETFSISFSQLYEAFSLYLVDDQSTLLLYTLLQRNSKLRSYFLSRTDLDMLVVPMLKLLYKVSEEKTHQMYMLLIILLVLSQDDAFNATVHDIQLDDVQWFTERKLNCISLGGLLVLVLVRTVQFNLSKLRDVYLHTNCLAALANMSSHFHSLHPYAAQRIVSLLQLLAKRYNRLLTVASAHAATVESKESSDRADGEDTESESAASDAVVYADFVRIVMEIINSALTHCLAQNPHLVYTLLHKSELFVPFRTNPRFQDLIFNIESVISFFNARIDSNTHDHELSAHHVFRVIQEAMKQWPSDRLKVFPALKFRYEEEEQPDEFFLPYVWTIIITTSGLFSNHSRISFFNNDE